ncbi:MAG: reverse transcriptase domain-containing protein [Hyphomicrobiaceae bacterium]
MTNPFRRRVAASLRNIYLDPLDRLMAERGYRMVRYADDFVILTGSREEADAALALVRSWAAENGLTLHPEKTRVGGRVEDARFQHDRQPGEGFEFLGYRFEAGRRDVAQEELRASQGCDPGEDAAQAGRQPRMRDRRSQPVAQGLVRLLQARPSLHLPEARRVHPTPAARAPAQAGETAGLGNSLADCRRWPNAFFATAGLFALHTAWHTARQSR